MTDYMSEVGIRVRYLHSDIDTLERTEIIRDMRLDVFDVLVGINLLREGLDIPEITLVAILDADKEGFCVPRHHLIQTIGRAARNAEGHVIMYADTITDSMQRHWMRQKEDVKIQMAYNEEHGITPKTIQKASGCDQFQKKWQQKADGKRSGIYERKELRKTDQRTGKTDEEGSGRTEL